MATIARSSARGAFAKTFALLAGCIAAAWALCVWAELSGAAVQLHHHTLYESGRPLWESSFIVLAAWQVMTAAMMLPSSLPFIRTYAAAAGNAPDFPRALLAFLIAYFAVWSGFAVAAFTGDMQLHHLVDATPWLQAHPQVIAAFTLAFAGIYQLTPLKDACLKACRNPGMYLATHYRRGVANGARIGLSHAAFCLGCCWALMLVMFAAGVAHLAWMGVLAIVMLVEKGFPRGDRMVVPVGIALIALGVIAMAFPGALGM